MANVSEYAADITIFYVYCHLTEASILFKYIHIKYPIITLNN